MFHLFALTFEAKYYFCALRYNYPRKQNKYMQNPPSALNFNNTEIAFKSKSNGELRNSYMLFKALGYPQLVKMGPPLVQAAFALSLPVKGLIKATAFKQFCGGENIGDCEKVIHNLNSFHIGTILDYSVEGKESEDDFDHT